MLFRSRSSFSQLVLRKVQGNSETSDTVHLVDEQVDPHVFDRATAQVRWPDGLGRSYLGAPGAETDSDYYAFVADQRLRYAADELSRVPASVTRNLAMRSDEFERLETAITAWKLARQQEEDA